MTVFFVILQKMSMKNLVLHLWTKLLSANQIAVFFDLQCLWKDTYLSYFLLYGDNHQTKLAFDTAKFYLGVANCASCPIRMQYSLIINISGESHSIYQIFCMEIIILCVGTCASCPNRLNHSLISNKTEKSQLI